MKTLLHCSTHIKTDYNASLLLTWFNLAQALNPGIDILIVDSASPVSPRDVLPKIFKQRLLNHEDEIPVIDGHTIVRFRDAIGHPAYDGITERSGPCRAWMKGIEVAIASGYERYTYIEYDVLCVKPLEWAFGQMTKPVATAGRIAIEPFDEVTLFYANVEFLWATDFVTHYNWRGPTQPFGELRMMNLLGDHRQILPLRGNRDEWQTPPDRLAERYPDGLDYLTHAHGDTLQAFLKMNGLGHFWSTVNINWAG